MGIGKGPSKGKKNLKRGHSGKTKYVAQRRRRIHDKRFVREGEDPDGTHQPHGIKK